MSEAENLSLADAVERWQHAVFAREHTKVPQTVARATELARKMHDLYPVSYVYTSVWSSFGHRFMSDGDGQESCLTCGGVWSLSLDESYYSETEPFDIWTDEPGSVVYAYGRYHAANGDDPTKCTGDTAQCHGEAPCQGAAGPDHDPAWGIIDIRECEDHPCKHESYPCNCLHCD